MFLDEIITFGKRVQGLGDPSNAQAFSVQNVFEYLIAQGKSSLDMDGIPVTPPYPKTWCEWRIPEGYWFGAMTTTIDVEEVSRMSATPRDGLRTFLRFLMPHDTTNAIPPWVDRLPSDPHTVLVTDVYAYGHQLRIPDLLGISFTPLRADGTMLEAETLYVALDPITDGELPESGRGISLYVFALLNCKNVLTDTHAVAEKLQRARIRRGKQPFITYHTLRIVAPGNRRTPPEESGEQLSDGSRAFHLVRGHFARYTADAPLFGKLTGVFWRPAHTRGSPSAGVRLKDYRLVVDRTDPA